MALSVLSASVIANGSEIEQLKHRLTILEQHQESRTKSPLNARFYATFRPSVTQSKNVSSSTDVSDFLSHAGLYLDHGFADGWQAIVHGEWSIDIATNGNFGKARRAYVGVEGPYGRIAIGKQRPVQYLLIAEYVDIFNHANAPFAYDNFSPFFVDNLVSYKKQWQRVSLLASGQFNGLQGANDADMFNIGVGYDHNKFHLAASYLTQDMPQESNTHQVGDRGVTYAISIANQFDNGLYLASAWQQRELESFIGNNSTQNTLDVSLAYRLNPLNKVKLGYFKLDDDWEGINNISYQGYNITLEHQFSDNFQVHIELLRKAFDFSHDDTALSIGLKYNFSIKWRSIN